MEPRLLLLDEPLSALDRGLRERLAHDLRDILVTAGTTALFVTHDQEEAFAVADRMALMRAGRVVQAGSLDEVWRTPADAEAARFLGYATVLDGDPARKVLGGRGDGPVALRRSALRVHPAGTLCGRVESARATPGQVRLTVAVDGAGVLPAVADLPAGSGAAVAVGEDVRLVVDLTRTAPVGSAGVVLPST